VTQHPGTDSPAKRSRPPALGESYRQSLSEFWWIVGGWAAFAVWNAASGYCFAFTTPPSDETIATVMGMPRWVFLTVFLPWVVGTLFILWFATRFMKDTQLGPAEDPAPGDSVKEV
jgi:hypothetical protein